MLSELQHKTLFFCIWRAGQKILLEILKKQWRASTLKCSLFHESLLAILAIFSCLLSTLYQSLAASRLWFSASLLVGVNTLTNCCHNLANWFLNMSARQLQTHVKFFIGFRSYLWPYFIPSPLLFLRCELGLKAFIRYYTGALLSLSSHYHRVFF